MLDEKTPFPENGAAALLPEGDTRIPVSIVRREGEEALISIPGRSGASGNRRVPIADLIDPATLEGPQALAAAVETFLIGRDDVRPRDLDAHLRERGFPSCLHAAVRVLRERGWNKRVRACGTFYVRPPTAEEIVDALAPDAAKPQSWLLEALSAAEALHGEVVDTLIRKRLCACSDGAGGVNPNCPKCRGEGETHVCPENVRRLLLILMFGPDHPGGVYRFPEPTLPGLALRAAEKLEAARTYVGAAIETFAGDPPDSDFQRGYLSALEDVAKEAFPAEPGK